VSRARVGVRCGCLGCSLPLLAIIGAAALIVFLAGCSSPGAPHATRPGRPAVISTVPPGGGVTYTYCTQARLLGRQMASHRGAPSRAQEVSWSRDIRVLESITPGGESGMPHAAQLILAEGAVAVDLLFMKDGTPVSHGWRATARQLENACG
jgi:hypothetical protein